MERRHSTTSESSTDSSTHSRQLSNDNAEIPTVGRGAKVTAPKPPANALQFVKTGPADLYRSAQEQLKKVEELKKATKQIRDEAEDWQSNLDNWKFSRRKRQEHIIERVVEVKKYELEEHERNRRRSKTFNEMIQDRNTRGRKTSLPVYVTDESNDLSDLGLGFTEKQYSEDNSTTSNDSDQGNEKSDLPKILENENEKDTDNNNIYNGRQTNGFREKEVPDENSEVEEYTYERAIQSYVNFAETRVKSRSTRSITEDTKPLLNGSTKDSPPVPSKPRRSSVASQKIENSISQLEQKKKSISTNDLVSDAVKKQPDLPKVDISKRKELFEKCRESEETTKKVNRLSSEVPTTRSIRDRLSSLKEQTDSSKSQTINKPSTEISVKDRLSSIEKLKDNGEANLPKRKSNDQLATQSIKDRLSNLEKVKNSPKVQSQTVETSVTIKDRLNSLQSACNKETPRPGPEKETQLLGEKLSNFQEMEAAENSYQTQGENYEQVLSAEDVYESSRHRHYRHRSLDSLDVDNDGASNETFERVQSLEDLDYCRNYPASSLSGDTDREDSGIHTADVSSSVSQADDYDLHLEANSVIDDLRVHHQPTIIEEIKQPLTNDSLIANQDVLSYDFDETTNQYNTEPVTLENLSEPAFNPLSKVDHENICTSPILAKQVSSPDEELKNNHLLEDSVNISPSNQIETFGLENESKLVNNDCMLEGGTQKSNNRSDRRRTVVEICFKVDSSDLKSPPVTPFISVDVSNTFCNEKVPNIVDMKTHEQEIDGTDIYCDLNTEYINGGSKFENPVSVTSHENREICENDITKPEMYNSSNMLVDSNGLDSSVIITDTKSTVTEQVFLPKDSIQNICYSQMGELFVNLNMDQEVESVFQLSPTTLEPPKEKPPPPPTDISDDETETNAPKKPVSLRRLDSTKRIKKEIRQKRSSFLGIEGNNDDSYLDPELELIRPPDMTTLLAEERRMERQLYRQSVCSESDSNQESRDSGVELDHKNHDLAWSHSRNDSETFGNQSTTSEEDEIMRKEREIIETLEQEERIRKQDLGEKLALRLRQLEAEKGREEWERIQQNELLRSTHQNHVTERNLIHALPQKPCSPTKESLDVNMQESMKVCHKTSEENVMSNQQDSSVREPIT